MFITILTSFRQAIRSLNANKLRSFLTIIGMVIGVASVILLLSVGKGAQQLILNEVKDLGSNVVFVLAGGDGGKRQGPPAAVRGIVVKTMKPADIDELEKGGKAPSLKTVSAFTGPKRIAIKVIGKKEEIAINARGRDRNFFTMRTLPLSEGRIWTEEEERAQKKIAVLGGGAKEKIFGVNSGYVVGKKLNLKGQLYEIIGVLEKKSGGLGSFFGQNEDESIIVPTEVAMKQLLGVDYILGFMAEARTPELVEQAITEIEEVLRYRHKIRNNDENDFSVRTQKDAIGILTTITTVFTVFLAAIAGISLVVGGIGIMNIMLVSVTERTREIGLRKAVGASRIIILIQFLIETLVMTILGGGIGIALGLLGAYGVSQLGNWSFVIDLHDILLAFGVSASFGLVFGLYPANKASKLDPIRALRYE